MEARQKIAASKIASLLEKKNSFLKEFLRLTARQKQALAEKDMDRFNELMEAKQSIIEQVDILDVKLVLHKNKSRETVHNEAGSSSGKPPMENPDRITELEQSVRQLLQQIKTLDLEVNDLMKQSLSETIKSINELQTARRTEAAYRSNTRPAHSFFINKKK